MHATMCPCVLKETGCLKTTEFILARFSGRESRIKQDKHAFSKGSEEKPPVTD